MTITKYEETFTIFLKGVISPPFYSLEFPLVTTLYKWQKQRSELRPPNYLFHGFSPPARRSHTTFDLVFAGKSGTQTVQAT